MMSISSLFQPRVQNETDAATAVPRAPGSRPAKLMGLTFLARHFRRRRRTKASYLNTGHISEHVRKDIGLKRSDFTKTG